MTTAIVTMLGFAMFLKMANGTTYSIVPFINKNNIGSVAGIVGAGGNVGGMLAGFLFKSATIGYSGAFVIIGLIVAAIGVLVLLTSFDKEKQLEGNTDEITSGLALQSVKAK